MILRADTGCHLSSQSLILGGPERVCAFGNGSSELCCLRQNEQKQKRGNRNTFNIMIKHMCITDRGNEISSDSSPDRGRDTMTLVTGGPISCVCVWLRFERVVLDVQKQIRTKAGKKQQMQHNEQAHAHHRSRQRDIIRLFPRSRSRYDGARNHERDRVWSYSLRSLFRSR